MKVRLLTAAGIFVIGLPLLLLSEYIIYPIALGILALIAVFEILRAIKQHREYFLSIPAYIIALLLPIFAHSYFVPANRQKAYVLVIALTLFGYLMWLAGCAVLSRGRITFDNLAKVFAAVTYVTVSFTSLSLIRYMDGGVFFFGLVFVSAWMCDTFAYFTGMLFGKHKLAPELSPKKTVEGSIGGVAFAIIGCMLYGLIVELTNPIDANYPVLAVTGLLLSVVAQIGDLFASLIKRENGIKDYSKLLPGHGGIMDRFDSILAVSTALLAICFLIPPLT